ncbi:MAG: hypothetical protein VW810_00520 [Pelagibacteraceae bacterium]
MRNLLTLLILNLIALNNVSAETSQNLVSQDFTQGWSGTNLSSKHGNGTIAGVNNQYVESDSVSLNGDVGLNKSEINQGFEIDSSAQIWFWNNDNQSVTMTTKAVDDNNQTITQNRTITGSCSTWNGCTYGTISDTMIFNSNTQQDYDLSLRFDFTNTTNTTGHYAADLKEPSMIVSYTPITINTAVETSLINLSDDLKDDVKDIEKIEIKEDKSMDTALVDNTEEKLDLEPKEQLSNDQDSTSMPSQEQPQEDNEENSVETKSEEKEQENQTTENTENKNEVSSTQEKSQESKASVSLDKSMSKFETKINNLDSSLKEVNQQKLSSLISSSIKLNYNVPFYKDKKIYENQIDMRDNRIIYTANLNAYIQNDPIISKEISLNNIRLKKQKLLKELEVLKNG